MFRKSRAFGVTTDQGRTADEAMFEHEQAIMMYLDEINVAIHDFPALESDGLDWGHVGTLAAVRSELEEIVRFLHNSG